MTWLQISGVKALCAERWDGLRQRQALLSFCGTPTRSNVAPPFDAAGDRHHSCQECSQDRHDHTQPDLIGLQPLALPFQE